MYHLSKTAVDPPSIRLVCPKQTMDTLLSCCWVFAACQGTLSCWKRPLPFEQSVSMKERRELVLRFTTFWIFISSSLRTSFPVDMTATTGNLCTLTSVTPTVASRPISDGPMCVPLANTHSPRLMSWPIGLFHNQNYFLTFWRSFHRRRPFNVFGLFAFTWCLVRAGPGP